MSLRNIYIIWFSVIILIGGSKVSGQPFKLYEVSDLLRVFEDGYNLPATRDTVKIFGIRGEIISGQCAIIATNNLTNVTAEFSALKNQSSAYTFPLNALEWNFVGSVQLSKNAPNQPLNALVRIAPAKFPDYLMAEKQISINSGTNKAIWLTVNIPDNAEAGIYTGKVTVKSTQGEMSLPLYVTVYPFSLPADRHLKIAEWYSTGSFLPMHGIPVTYSNPWFAMLRTYADNMVAHRQNVFRISMSTISIQMNNSGVLFFDFSRFDQLAQVFWDTQKMDYLETGFLAHFETGSWSSTEITLNNYSVKELESGLTVSLQGTEVIPYLLPAFESHLRQKGWLGKTLFHIQDEPSPHNSLAWCKISQYMHQWAPNLIRMDAIESPFVLDDIEVAVPKLDHFGDWYESYKTAQQKGVELWFYTVGIYQAGMYPNKTIDMPLSDSRIMHWLNYKYDATGYLHWGWNSWTENPYLDVGQHIGDAWHVYPVANGVLNSLRWEQMRNGIQDYEYFWLLENNIRILKDSLGPQFNWIEPKQRSKEIINNVVMGFTENSDDPQVFYKAKMEVIKDLQEFYKSPGIYLQTYPGANSTIESGSTVAIVGWTEPGTKITVNGSLTPVNDKGIFMKELGLSSKYNTIKVQASNPKGTKELVRTFKIKNYNTGINEFPGAKHHSLLVYPNPINQFMTVELPEISFDLLITDALGRTVFIKENNFDRAEIDCIDFPKGIYFVIAKNNKTSYSSLVIKQ